MLEIEVKLNEGGLGLNINNKKAIYTDKVDEFLDAVVDLGYAEGVAYNEKEKRAWIWTYYDNLEFGGAVQVVSKIEY